MHKMCCWLNVVGILMVLSALRDLTHAAPRTRYNKECRTSRECIEIKECPHFVALLNSTRKPRPRYVIQEIIEYQCGFNGDIPKVCCLTSTSMESSETPMIMPVEVLSTEQIMPPTFGKKKEEGNPPDVSSHKNLALLPSSDGCGRIQHSYRIFGGTQTSVSEFPWMALIIYTTRDGFVYRCAGSLINERYVLTAAHCASEITMVGVRLGEHNIKLRYDCDPITGVCAPPVQDFYIEDLLIHPDYKTTTLENDIALIRLATPVNLDLPHIQPICLPIGYLADYDLEKKKTIVSGWGVTETGYRNPELSKVSVPVISNHECRKIYQNSLITERQICAGGVLGRDSCRGDSGGPLFYNNFVNTSMRYVQHGIVSYGPQNCGSEGLPGIYTRISHYMDWILDNIKR